jgi:multicomponent Na+:H+ antiporter subunit E
MRGTALVFGACLAFWILLSGHLDPLSLALGAASAALVTAANRRDELLSPALRAVPRFVTYLPWLLKEMALASLQVAWVVVHPRLPIEPVVVRYTPPVRSELALTTLGNSITLTPGTLTLDVEDTTLVVHALTSAAARGVLDGAMARRVAWVFAEDGR